MYKWVFFMVLFLFCAWETQAQKNTANDPKKLATYSLFVKIRKLWLKEEHRQLQKFLAKRIRLNLGTHKKGVFNKDLAVGIIKAHFKKLSVLSFRYYPKKMKLTRAAILYRYRIKNTGVKKKKLLYLYLSREKKKEYIAWVIERINVIG